jgi:hypothetical protein
MDLQSKYSPGRSAARDTDSTYSSSSSGRGDPGTALSGLYAALDHYQQTGGTRW